MRFRLFQHVTVILTVATLSWATLANAQNNPCLLIVIEDLRPEFVTRATMPNLYSLGKKGVTLSSHHAVFPTIPIVNAMSIGHSTYPTLHGYFDNSHEFPPLLPHYDSPVKCISASTSNLSRALTAPSPPPQITAVIDRNAWVVDHYFREGYELPYVTMWFDGRDENHEIGSKEHYRILKKIDDLIETIVKKNKKRKRDINLFITSSGGTLTPVGEPHSLTDLLIQNNLKAGPDSDDVTIKEGNQINVKNHDLKKIREIAALLQKTPWIGAIYTQQIRVTHPEGKAKGALSFQSVYINTEKSPDILIEPAWTDTPNKHGIPGTVQKIGVGDTPTSSPYALQIPLIAIGPNIKTKTQSDVPTANIDLGPTIHQIVGYKTGTPRDIAGRILHEILKNGPDPEDVKVLKRRHGAQVELEGLTYRLMMTEYSVNGVDYLHSTSVERRVQ